MTSASLSSQYNESAYEWYLRTHQNQKRLSENPVYFPSSAKENREKHENQQIEKEEVVLDGGLGKERFSVTEQNVLKMVTSTFFGKREEYDELRSRFNRWRRGTPIDKSRCTWQADQ